jgi:hypothetical protein
MDEMCEFLEIKLLTIYPNLPVSLMRQLVYMWLMIQNKSGEVTFMALKQKPHPVLLCMISRYMLQVMLPKIIHDRFACKKHYLGHLWHMVTSIYHLYFQLVFKIGCS